MARRAERRVVAGPFFVLREILPRRRQCPAAEANLTTAPNFVRWRGIARGEGTDRRKVRRVPDARRSTGARARKDCRFARTACPPQSAAAEIRRGRICDG